jgi:hypothetical protein
MSLRQEHRELRRDHAALVDDHLALTADHQQLREAYNRQLEQLMKHNQQQEMLIKAGDAMYHKLESALDKVQTLLQRHIAAGEAQVPARALWHILHEAGIAVAPKPPAMDHALHVALKNAPALEQQNQQSQGQKPEQKQVHSRGMRI